MVSDVVKMQVSLLNAFKFKNSIGRQTHCANNDYTEYLTGNKRCKTEHQNTNKMFPSIITKAPTPSSV